jgi:membrane protease subunit HflK
MSTSDGAALQDGAMMSEDGPWGGRGNEGGKPEGPKNPWDLPTGANKPRRVRGKPAVDDFVTKLRGLSGGGGGGFGGNLPQVPSRSLWAYGALGIVALWLLFTSFHRIDAQERGVVTRFGRYSHTLQPGISMTLPAPIDRVQTVNVENIRFVDIPEGAGEKLVLTRDQNIVNLDYRVRWNIKSPEQYLFQLVDPEKTINAVAESAMRAAVANMTLNEVLGPGRDALGTEVALRMQALLDRYNAGIRVQGVAVQRADPPEAVNDAFKDVTAAQQDAQASANQANAYAQQVIAKARGEAGAFDRVYTQYKAAPGVTRRRMYYETMEKVLAKTDKTIVEPGVSAYLPLPARPQAPVQPQAREGGR